ncbi:hypothetical protein HYPSUDRAFT_634895 [Hypholoma sublateritium FD-334 SS-4]|uniref:Uncharacterized protein n=1 Tax=Hypholoma sublateritium (strain FD-334 SS-4) TaxID=945553 RepID=A0A0D2MY83_HYPSF|nr:hypothetical protein HYPSUDRAFT_634895 [Hypholoma sublateritium FD-334 SS-4]
MPARNSSHISVSSLVGAAQSTLSSTFSLIISASLFCLFSRSDCKPTFRILISRTALYITPQRIQMSLR